ncbi:MAG: tRNA dihydrouridine synthase DusB [Chlamydiota bacterium]|jgi:nifR3 family TIM-barrel protein
MSFKKNFHLGSLKLSNNIFYAPLAGCSDLAFRRMSKIYNPGLFFCEMVKMDALIRYDPNTFRLLDYTKDMHPIGAQICGSKPEIAYHSAKIIEDLGFDVIDLNCGCPVDKVTKDGSGSALLSHPERIGEILHEMVAAVKIPVTVKIRAGYDDQSVNAPEIVTIAEKAGAKCITVHGRTRKQAYKGLADRDVIKECKARANTIYVFGNGDIFDVPSAHHMFQHTECDGIVISRGSMGQPWIADDIRRYYDSGEIVERDTNAIKEHLLKHFQYILEYKSERKALLEMRKVGCWYLKNCIGVKQIRQELNKASSTLEMLALINNFSWEESNERTTCAV